VAGKKEVIVGAEKSASENGISEKQREVYKYIAQGGFWPTSKISKVVALPDDAVRRIVSRLRKKHKAGSKEIGKYIYLARAGYTIEERADVVMHEASFRYKLGMGVLVNGMHVFMRARTVCASSFRNLKLQYTKKKDDLTKVL
jgi:hypothetical protein